MTIGDKPIRKCAVVGCPSPIVDGPTLLMADATATVNYEFCFDHGRQVNNAYAEGLPSVERTWDFPPGSWNHDGSKR